MFKDETFLIRGAIFEVYKEIGSGFLEAVYQECLEKELYRQKIPFKSQVEISISYKGEVLNKGYIADLICFDKIILELKAVKAFDNVHRAQIQNYLKATGMRIGLLINFGSYPKAVVERIIF
jgi:GxxExxY protein